MSLEIGTLKSLKILYYIIITIIILNHSSGAEENSELELISNFNSTCPDSHANMICTCSNNDNRISLLCTHGNWNDIRDELQAYDDQHVHIDTLSLISNNIPFLKEGLFAQLDIKNLVLVDNGIRKIDSECFGAFHHSLKLFKLVQVKEDTKVTSDAKFTGDLFKAVNKFKNLKHLSIESNSMHAIGKKVINRLGALESLELIVPEIIHIDSKAFYGLSSLRQVTLRGNFTKFQTLMNIFAPLRNLRSLRIVNSSLNHFTKQVLSQLGPKLTHLSLSHNKITNVSTGLYSSLANLLHLDLSGNQIKVLGNDNFAGLKQLQILDLGCNAIDRVYPKAFNELSNLRSLNLSFNCIMDLNGSLDQLPNLTSLHLYHNHITQFGENVIKSTFENSSLRHLNLSANRITRIEGNSMIGQLAHVTDLDLSHNELTAFSIDLKLYPGLQCLLLNHNNLSTLLIQNVNASAQSLKILNLSGNPWRCDCNLSAALHLYRTLNNFSSLDSENAVCSGPLEFSGRKLTRVQQDELGCQSNSTSPPELATIMPKLAEDCLNMLSISPKEPNWSENFNIRICIAFAAGAALIIVILIIVSCINHLINRRRKRYFKNSKILFRDGGKTINVRHNISPPIIVKPLNVED